MCFIKVPTPNHELANAEAGESLLLEDSVPISSSARNDRFVVGLSGGVKTRLSCQASDGSEVTQVRPWILSVSNLQSIRNTSP